MRMQLKSIEELSILHRGCFAITNNDEAVVHTLARLYLDVVLATARGLGV